MDVQLAYSEPFASTSRAVFTLPYKPEATVDDAADGPAELTALKLYERAWSTCNAKIQSILASLHEASLDQIVAFVQSKPSNAQELYAALGDRAPIRAGLIIGASPGSSSLLYSSLTRQLTENSYGATGPGYTAAHCPCYVSRLASRDCSNIKNALRSLIGGFVGSDVEIEADDDEDIEDAVLSWGPSTLKSALIVPEDLSNLKAWYEHRFGKKGSENAPSLVVLLEDLEAMDGKVLTQLIDALSGYTDALPLTLLIGIATTADAFYSMIARKTAHKLDAARFFVDPGVTAFNALIRGLFVDWRPPLALAPETYTDLRRTFEDLHHSIDATISFIQYLYMAHFTTHPCAGLTLLSDPTSAPASSDDARVPADVASICALPSVQRSAVPDTAPLINPATPAANILSTVMAARAAVDSWYSERSVAFECLLGLMEFWDKRKPLEATLGLLLGEQEGEVNRLVDQLCGLVLQASSYKLPRFLRSLSARLRNFTESRADLTRANHLGDFLSAQLSALEPILAAPRPAGKSTLFNTNLTGGVGGLPGLALQSASGVGEADRDFSRIAKETAEGLKVKLRFALRSPKDLFLHELWFTSDSSAMKRLYPTPLPTLLRQLAKLDPLNDPAYAPPSDDDPDQRQVEESAADLGVAYRVYREMHAQGRLVNLGEWWSGFELGAVDEGEGKVGPDEASEGGGRVEDRRKRRRAQAEDEDEEREATSDEEQDEEEDEDEDELDGPGRRKQARFLRCLGDLAHLGFVHPTTYKPEHVLKSAY